jgi:hypothetical protein
VEATVLRLPGQMYKTVGDSIQNVYSIKIINKTNDEYDNLKIKMIDHKGSVKVIGGQVNVPKLGMDEKTLFITISKKDIGSSKEKIKIGIYKNGELIESDKTNFPAPMKIR